MGGGGWVKSSRLSFSYFSQPQATSEVSLGFQGTWFEATASQEYWTKAE